MFYGPQCIVFVSIDYVRVISDDANSNVANVVNEILKKRVNTD